MAGATAGGRRAARRAAAVAGGLMFGLVVAEGAARLVWPAPEPERAVAVRCGDCPHLYQLDPTAEEVGPLGLRDPRRALDGIADGPRLLVLGDSVVHGGQVPIGDRFTDLLESELARTRPGTQVINAGVPGYSTFNERTWYEAEGRALAPRLVLLVVCLNDVTDPLLHWNFLGHQPWSGWEAADGEIPAAAIPDPDYHRDHVVAPLRQRRLTLWLHEHLALFRRFGGARGWAGPLGGMVRPHRRTATVDGRPWPVQLTTEDELPISVWTDDESPQWRWFTAELDALAAGVAADGAQLALAVAPLAYQLDEDYPILPQRRIAALADRRGIPFVDLLPALRGSTDGDVFLPGDDWHLSRAGHARVARALGDLIEPLLFDEAGGQSSSTNGGIRSAE
jgi:lysophospholipase L1-like esterase